MSMANIPGVQACKPVLNAPAEVLAGYRTLHIQEAKYTGKALEARPEEVAVWHRFLTLFSRTMRKEHLSPYEIDDDAHTAWGLRLSLTSAAAGTAKLALDATLAGYYSQAYGLIRHMLETWQQMVYVRLNNSGARQWFSHDGVSDPQQPSQRTIARGIRKFGKGDSAILNNLSAVEYQMRSLNKGAHPTVLAVMQTDSPDPEIRQFGANYIAEHFYRTWTIGTIALAMVLHEIVQSEEVDAEWWAEYLAIQQERSRLHDFHTEPESK